MWRRIAWIVLCGAGAGASMDTSPDKPDLITALRKQLGLRLERKTVPSEVLVVDSADKLPTGQ